MDRSLNEIVYSIKETLRDYSDDTDVSTEHLKYLVNTYRAQFLRRDLSKPGRYVDESIKQDIGCLRLELSDPADCCAVTSDCTILRTEKEIPHPVELRSSPLITSVGPINILQSRFEFVSYHRAIYSGNGDFNQQSIFAFYFNNRIYIKSNPDNKDAQMLEYIKARGVFQDPTAIKNFEDCESGTPCYNDDMDYPMNTWMIPMVKDAVIKEGLQLLKTPPDNENNSEDDRVFAGNRNSQ